MTRNLLLYMDPPQHTNYRLILQRAFTPHAVKALEDPIRARVTRTIDRFIERGSADLVSELAVPVPLGVITDLLGVPDEDFEQFLGWTETVEEATRSPEPEQAAEVFGLLAGYLAEQIARQNAEGRDDTILAKLRDAQVEGRPLTDTEILVFFALLAFAGHDTTRNTTSTGILALLEHPAGAGRTALESVADPRRGRGDPALDERRAVVQPHGDARDTELGGQQDRRGRSRGHVVHERLAR